MATTLVPAELHPGVRDGFRPTVVYPYNHRRTNYNTTIITTTTIKYAPIFLGQRTNWLHLCVQQT
jgi:hypothetical protein